MSSRVTTLADAGTDKALWRERVDVSMLTLIKSSRSIANKSSVNGSCASSIWAVKHDSIAVIPDL
jgi:hypothetical protein